MLVSQSSVKAFNDPTGAGLADVERVTCSTSTPTYRVKLVKNTYLAVVMGIAVRSAVGLLVRNNGGRRFCC